MAYLFAGFFAKPAVPLPQALPDGTVWRHIESPFSGIGIRLPTLIDKCPDLDEVEALARRLGVITADDWIYLTYTCWGGSIDFVYGLGSRHGCRFGPIEESDILKVKTAYTTLMGEFGVSSEDSLQFRPFTRGFWGDA